jgi:NADPH-ferrihemoprotein reductase
LINSNKLIDNKEGKHQCIGCECIDCCRAQKVERETQPTKEFVLYSFGGNSTSYLATLCLNAPKEKQRTMLMPSRRLLLTPPQLLQLRYGRHQFCHPSSYAVVAVDRAVSGMPAPRLGEQQGTIGRKTMSDYCGLYDINNNTRRQQQRQAATVLTRTARYQSFAIFPTKMQFRSLMSSAAPEPREMVESLSKPVKIVYASQTGTAQLFAMQLADALDQFDVEICPMNKTGEELSSEHTYIFLVSTTGVGEPPDNARAFYKKLLNRHPTSLQGIQYTIFALGNSKAHPQHYCAFGKNLQHALNAAGAKEFMPTTLGDDGGECLDDDFDQWQDMLVKHMLSNVPTTTDTADSVVDGSAGTCTVSDDVASTSNPRGSLSIPSVVWNARPSGQFPKLKIASPDYECRSTTTSAPDLLDKVPTFYAPGAKRYVVQHNAIIRSDSPNAAVNPSALRELQIYTGGDVYGTGDHLMVYPRNSDVLVEAYCNVLSDASLDLHAPIMGAATEGSRSYGNSMPYPHPTGITTYETLRHCVDLQAPPSPNFARFLTGKGRDVFDYRSEVAIPRRTVLELLLESPEPSISLENLLYQLPSLQPRYYSIASSQYAQPNSIYLTYRPIKYVNSRGVLHEGVCTSYLSYIPSGTNRQCITATIRSNPSFRLPETAPGQIPPPILLIAGGCGVAPIRAFLEELIWNAHQSSPKPFGKVHLFLGFRNPDDSVYNDIVAEAANLGILDGQNMSFTTGCDRCSLVSDTVLDQGSTVYRLLAEQNACAYICGGARTFGVAIQNAFQHILFEHGGMDVAEASTYLQELMKSGRFHEDLSD